MSKVLSSFLNLLDFESVNILFQQREGEMQRTPFAMEKQVLEFVKEGKPNEMVAYYRKLIKSQPSFKVSVSKLSKDELRHFKYMAVSAIAIVCRVAMYSGTSEAVSYSMSDEAIQKIDKMENPDKILFFLTKLVYDYAKLVKKSKKNITYSKPVRDGIEYITANLHSKIAINHLIKNNSYTKEYYAKLFKKEVGKTITDYILNLRINEAKKMILEGKPFNEIAYTLQFCSQSYFIQQFKKVEGITPREFKLLNYNEFYSPITN